MPIRADLVVGANIIITANIDVYIKNIAIPFILYIVWFAFYT